jgi:hypothetical protein
MSGPGPKLERAQTVQMFSGLPPEADSDLRVNEYTPYTSLVSFDSEVRNDQKSRIIPAASPNAEF